MLCCSGPPLDRRLGEIGRVGDAVFRLAFARKDRIQYSVRARALKPEGTQDPKQPETRSAV